MLKFAKTILSFAAILLLTTACGNKTSVKDNYSQLQSKPQEIEVDDKSSITISEKVTTSSTYSMSQSNSTTGVDTSFSQFFNLPAETFDDSKTKTHKKLVKEMENDLLFAPKGNSFNSLLIDHKNSITNNYLPPHIK